MLVATRGARPIGYAVLLTRRGGQSARLYSIAVGAEEAGRGIGSRLVAAAEDAAIGRGARRLHLEVRADNPGAMSFYERLGYHPAGQRPNYYDDGMTALLFARHLPDPARTAIRLRRFSRAA